MQSDLLVAAVFASAASVTAYLLAPDEAQAVTRKRLREIRLHTELPDALERQELSEPFAHRVLRPMAERLVGVLIRVTPAGYRQRLEHRLREAGNPMGVGTFVLTKATATALAALVLVPLLAQRQPLAGVAAAVLGWSLPDLWLSRVTRARLREISRSLPDVIDLLSVSVEAGTSFDGAVQKVSEKFAGATAREFAEYLKEVRLGRSREEALRALADRVALDELRSFAAAVIQADRLGVSLSRVLRVQASQIRERRRMRAEEQAMRVPVKLVFPLVFFIFPSLLVVLLGPAVIRILTVLTGQGAAR